MQKYKDAVHLRNLAFVELLRAGIPFICIEDDDIIRISLDETSYDIDIATVKSAMNDEEYDKIINKTDFSEGFNPDKEIAVDEQKNSEFEILQQKIASYGSTEEPDSKKDAPKEHTAVKVRLLIRRLPHIPQVIRISRITMKYLITVLTLMEQQE